MNPVPHHIAIVMDGNGRWATQHFLPRLAGHRQGVEALRQCVKACAERGIAVLTIFAFSSENWQRPVDEVSGLMDIFVHSLTRQLPSLQSDGVQLHFVGDRSGLSEKISAAMEQAERATRSNAKLIFNICFNYGGRWDIVQAAAKLVARGETISESAMKQTLALAHVPDPDLVIRTGGEQRISNFLLWQSAYAEFYFSDKLWPAFDVAELSLAIDAFMRRERRFGRTSDQLTAPASA